jgi:hypothetical protein
LVPPTLPFQVGYVLLPVNMKQLETMRHMLEYPPGPRDQQLIQLVPPTLSLQVGYVLLLVNIVNMKKLETMGHMLEYPQGPRDQQLIQLVPPTLSLQLGHEENEEKQGNEYFSNLELNKEKYKESEC